jgi:hypothetical protein
MAKKLAKNVTLYMAIALANIAKNTSLDCISSLKLMSVVLRRLYLI